MHRDPRGSSASSRIPVRSPHHAVLQFGESVADASKDTAEVAVTISTMSTDLDVRVSALQGLLLAA
jgi:hypothetical protein